MGLNRGPALHTEMKAQAPVANTELRTEDIAPTLVANSQYETDEAEAKGPSLAGNAEPYDRLPDAKIIDRDLASIMQAASDAAASAAQKASDLNPQYNITEQAGCLAAKGADAAGRLGKRAALQT